MASPRLCLVVVFNHRFDKNLPILDKLYRGRFDHFRYLMPFYDGPRKDVIPVYRSSYVFQGYIADATAQLTAEGFDSYVFIGDDVLLNGRLNQDNLLQELGATDAAYIKELIPMWDRPTVWRHVLPAFRAFKLERYNEFQTFLPSHAKFVEAFERHGHTWRSMSRRELLPYLLWDIRQERPAVIVDNLMFWLVHLGGRTKQYPIYYSYSDFLIVPGDRMAAFGHLCGVFASMGLFVEVAIPTALMLTCDRILLEKDSRLKGEEVLPLGDRDALIAQHGSRLDRIVAAMPADQLYIHPVKLSLLNSEGV